MNMSSVRSPSGRMAAMEKSTQIRYVLVRVLPHDKLVTIVNKGRGRRVYWYGFSIVSNETRNS